MFTLYDCKPAFQDRLRPWVNRLAQGQVSANQITVAALFLSGGMGLALAIWSEVSWVWLGLPLVLLIRMALNAIDGMLAREHNLASPLGCILNELGDVIADAALYLPFSLVKGISAPGIVGIVILATWTELVGVLGEAIAQKRCYDGPMGKSDRALVFSGLALGLGLGLSPAPWWNGIELVVIGLLLWTILNRVRTTLKATAEEVKPCQ
jgi:CDP-diacylglycerol---glycerol-3-phosphate 3-phosphatidyltransferase